MILTEVRRLLSDLEKLVGGWNSVSEISAIERDLALGKLAAIYDALRFEPAVGTIPAEAVSSEPEVVPVPIDLSELLAPGHSVDDLLPAEPTAEAPDMQSEETAVRQIDPEVETVPIEATAPFVEIVEEPATLVEPTTEPAATAVPNEIPDAPGTSTTEKKLATPEDMQSKAAEPPTVYVAPTLFGPEEAFVRHRHKQRVIMSLYDNDPAVSRTDGQVVKRATVAPSSDSPSKIPNPSIATASVTTQALQEPETNRAESAPLSESVPEAISAEELAAARSLATAALAEEIPQPEAPVAETIEVVEIAQKQDTAAIALQPVAEESTPAEPDDTLPAAEEFDPAAEQPDATTPMSHTEATVAEKPAPESVFERLAAAAAEAKKAPEPESDVRTSEYTEDADEAIPPVQFEEVRNETAKTDETAETEETEETEPDPFEEIRTEPEIPAEPEFRSAEHPTGTVLGEVMNHDVRTLADTIAPARDIAAALNHGGRIVELRRAIGLNDKFLLIRDLFGGDASAYEQAIRELDTFDDFDDCMIHIAEHYAWNPDSDGARLLMELLERKFA